MPREVPRRRQERPEGSRPQAADRSRVGIMTSTKSSNRITIPVSGMTCAACQGRVQRVLEKAPGVEDATVNLLLNNATVRFDPNATSPQRLVETIRGTGYGAELPAPTDGRGAVAQAFAEEEAQDRARDAEFRDRRRK